MSDHYCCKRCGLRYDDCRCPAHTEAPRMVEQKVSPESLLSRMEVVMAGGHIKRYHMKRTLYSQTVGEHSGRVANLVQLVHPGCSADLLKAALMHDTSELSTGDVASPVKWANPLLASELNRITNEYEERFGLRMAITEDEAGLLKWADYAEGNLFCIDEMLLGNRNMVGTFHRYHGALTKLRLHPDDTIARNQRVINKELETRGMRLCQ